VYAEPELLVWRLNGNDKFAVIASDGVFEFLTSQAVVDAISKFTNPLDAAKRVVSEAYRLWLTYDDRTDDITIIIIYFDEITARKDAAILPVVTHHNITLAEEFKNIESKPVRSAMSKAKRKVISEAWGEEKTEDFDFAANATEKVRFGGKIELS
jgi:predicted DNA-binding protein